MSTTQASISYRELVERTRPSDQPASFSQENELDALVHELKDREQSEANGSKVQAADPIQRVRDIMVGELMPAFIELVEKYSRSGVKMEMDASDLLGGGREVVFEFNLSEHQLRLHGTVTAEAIALKRRTFMVSLRADRCFGCAASTARRSASSFVSGCAS